MKKELNPPHDGNKQHEKDEPTEYELNCDGVMGENKGGGEEGTSAVAEGGGETGGASKKGEGEIKEETGVNEEVRSKDAAGKGDSKGSGRKEIRVEFLPLDLSSFESTIECVRLFKEKSLPLHILVNNAAVAWTPFGEHTLTS